MIPVSEPVIGREELKNVVNAVKSGWISSKGEYIDIFESEIAKLCNTKHAVSVMNGTAALHLALASLGIKKGDEVIVPAFTMIATTNAVVYTGATPVFIDSDTETWNIDIKKIEENITEKTKAIIPVHIFGQPCDMDPITEMAKKHNIFVIEDAAEAHGSRYKGRTVGSIGDIGCFSFYANKLITTGEGGAITTNNDAIADKARCLRNHAFDKERTFIHNDIGFNYRMTNLQAAIGIAQIKKIGKIIKMKKRVFKTYNKLLRDIPELKLQKQIADVETIGWMFAVTLSEECKKTRNDVRKILVDAGIETRLLFFPANKQPAYSNISTRGGPCSTATMLYERGFYLPSSPTLKKEQIEFIVETLKKAL
jgi:perosamine synthetase